MSESKHSAEFVDGARAKEAKKSKKAGVSSSTSAVSLDPGVELGKCSQIPRLLIPEAKSSARSSDRPSKSRTAAKKQQPVDKGVFQNDLHSSRSQQIDLIAESRTDVAAAQDHAQTARREAKKKRPKETEKEIYERDNDVVKQLLVEGIPPEEKIRREKRRQTQLDALNANAEECQEEDDYEDEDFEKYDDENTHPTIKNAPGTSMRTLRRLDDEVGPVINLRTIKRALEVESNELLSKTSVETNDPESIKTSNAREKSLPSTESDGSAVQSLEELKRSLDPRARRIRALLSKLTLENETFYMFNQAPTKDHDRYMNSLRRGKIRQAFVQCNDGAKGVGVQTKGSTLKHQSMNFPDDIGMETGNSSELKELLPGRRRHDDTNDENGTLDGLSTVGALFSRKFMDFVNQAAFTCELIFDFKLLLNVEAPETGNKESLKSLGIEVPPNLFESRIFPSKNASPLLHDLNRLLEDRELTWLIFSSGLTNHLLSCYGLQVCEDDNDPSQWKRKSITCIWHVAAMEHPQYVLQCEDRIQIAVFGPFLKEPLVIGGTSDGSLHLWDLRECNLHSKEVPFTDPVLPTHSTCDSRSVYHSSAIVDIQNVQSQASKSLTLLDFSCHIGTLDDRGILILWSLIEFHNENKPEGFLNLVMNQKIDTQEIYNNLISRQCKTMSGNQKHYGKHLWAEDMSQSHHGIGPIASVLRFLPSDSSQYLLGTTTGRIIHGNRYESQHASRNQRNQLCCIYLRGTISSRRIGVDTIQLPACVSIEFNPFLEDYFLAGYEDGVISIFRAGNSTSLCVWDGFSCGLSAVCTLEWSVQRPSVFLCSLACGTIQLWDLLLSTHAPVLCQDTTGGERTLSDTSEGFKITSSRRFTNGRRICVAYPTRKSNDAPHHFEVRELHSSLSRGAHSEEIEFLKHIFASFV
uniref:Uncharacterized protein AlNc14C109G6323 n=1 Tax=Albugo laibachii Nc14 TaxID=890382 RepID=F0WIC2_9STRA|nr:conserved hypothetical protein [Albugo laibachii Nc14]|eukprot:CCA21003.1 conserved hypothetical protein [Albugo laibachii Nc14]